MDAEPTGLWDKKQAATYLGIAVNTLNHWICERKIVFVKMGTLVKFRKSDLDRFILKNTKRPRKQEDDGDGSNM